MKALLVISLTSLMFSGAVMADSSHAVYRCFDTRGYGATDLYVSVVHVNDSGAVTVSEPKAVDFSMLGYNDRLSAAQCNELAARLNGKN